MLLVDLFSEKIAFATTLFVVVHNNIVLSQILGISSQSTFFVCLDLFYSEFQLHICKINHMFENNCFDGLVFHMVYFFVRNLFGFWFSFTLFCIVVCRHVECTMLNVQCACLFYPQQMVSLKTLFADEDNWNGCYGRE